MYTRKNISLKNMLLWTGKEILFVALISSVPVIFYDVLEQKWLHLPWLPIALVGTAVAFIVSFKNNAAYDRLWEARKVWGGIVNTSRSFAVLVNTYITNHGKEKVSDEELRAIKKTIINRHIAWMTAHRYTLRQEKQWERFKTAYNKKGRLRRYYSVKEWDVAMDKEIQPYLSEKEFNEIKGKRSAATQILSMQSNHLKVLKEKGLIWEFSHLEMENQIVELFTLQGKNERIKNFPYPRQYATLNLFFVWIFVILLPFGIMNEFEAIGAELASKINSSKTILDQCYSFAVSHFIWLSVPFSVVVSWIFLTMERIGVASENPFEGTANDIPITSMSRAIEIDILQVIGESEVPDAIGTKNDVMM